MLRQEDTNWMVVVLNPRAGKYFFNEIFIKVKENNHLAVEFAIQA